MHESISSYPYEDNPLKSTEEKNTGPSSRYYPQNNSSLCPIDETEDFHDPFSDLNLFLSKKIKQEVVKHGSSKQWSHKIQSDLLSHILPEFKLLFPKYRLGVSAIKKVWEKVSYYYGKVQTHQEALHSDGKLNIEFIIKENLRGYPSKLTSHLPPYHIAHQLAVKVSECIATLDGTKPRLDHLTKTIWSIQKHLIPSLPSQKSKNIYDEYDNIDKLIIKILLENIALNPLVSQKQLYQDTLKELQKIKTLVQIPQETLYQNLAASLAVQASSHLPYFSSLAKKDKAIVEEFLKHQIALGKTYHSNSIEISQRILSLYLLATTLPKQLDDKSFREAIAFVYCSMREQQPPLRPQISQGLLTWLYAEMHFLKRKKEFDHLEKITNILQSAFNIAKQLPAWKEQALDELEVLIWLLLNEKEASISSSLKELLREEITNSLLDFPTLTFRNRLYHLIDYFKKIKQTLCKPSQEEETLLFEEIEHKVYAWTLQNTMLCRWIHFDTNTPLFKTFTQLLSECDKSVSLTRFMDKIAQTPHLTSLPSRQLNIRAAIFYHYNWYQSSNSSQECSLNRFLEWHWLDIRSQYPQHSCEESLVLIENRCANLLPLCPISRKTLEQFLKIN